MLNRLALGPFEGELGPLLARWVIATWGRLAHQTRSVMWEKCQIKQRTISNDEDLQYGYRTRRDCGKAGVFTRGGINIANWGRKWKEIIAPQAKLKKRVYALTNSNRKMKNKNLLHRALVQNNPEPKSRNAADHFLSILHTRRLI